MKRVPSLLAAHAGLITLALGQSGTLDPSFGVGGIASFDQISGNALVGDVAVAADGDWLIAGKAGNDAFILKVDHSGALDPAFGVGGIATITDPTILIFMLAVDVAPDGSIYAVGESLLSNSTAFVVMKWDASGDPDLGFGTNGIAVFDLNPDNSDGAHDVQALPDGTVLVAGPSHDAGLGAFQFGMVRILDDGTPDPSFASGGIFLMHPGGFLGGQRGVARRSDGSLVLCGDVPGALGLLNDGAPDPGFGTGGFATVPTATWDVAIAAGDKPVLGDFYSMGAVRLNADGSPDAGFGPGGTVNAGPGTVTEVLVQPDDKVLLVGGVGGEMAVHRLTTDGASDADFGTAGQTIVPISQAFGKGGAIDAEGRIALVGLVLGGDGENSPAIAQLLNDAGQLVPSSDQDRFPALLPTLNDGRFTISSGFNAPSSYCVVDPAGRIVHEGSLNDPVTTVDLRDRLLPGSYVALIGEHAAVRFCVKH